MCPSGGLPVDFERVARGHLQQCVVCAQVWRLCNMQGCEWDSSFRLFSRKLGGSRQTYSWLNLSWTNITSIFKRISLKSVLFCFVSILSVWTISRQAKQYSLRRTLLVQRVIVQYILVSISWQHGTIKAEAVGRHSFLCDYFSLVSNSGN